MEEREEEIVVRLKINERIWREVKAGAASRGEPVQEFAANLLWAGLRLVDKKEEALEDALKVAEEKFLSRGFRVLRGGAILFERNRELHMELIKENIHVSISYLGIWIDRDLDFTIGGGLWSPEDFYGYLFSWDNVPGSDSRRLIEHLMAYHSAADMPEYLWESAEICKSDDGKTISILADENSAEIMLAEMEEKATLKISNGRTHDLKVKKEDGKLNIYSYKIEYENETEEKIVLELLQIAEETFSAILRDYAKLNLHRKENGRMI